MAINIFEMFTRYNIETRTVLIRNLFGLLLSVLIIFLNHKNAVSQENRAVINAFTEERYAWNSSWITHATNSVYDYGVIIFRNNFNLFTIPDTQLVYVSADNGYRLFVNGSGLL